MCGIAGIMAMGGVAPRIQEAELLRVRDAMSARGPDGAGLWTDPERRIGLGHRRLAIIDLSPAGAQPMATSDGRLVITFNGEIYNYRELMTELKGEGVTFRSSSDTEVLLHLYRRYGSAMVSRLRGMFAFAIWDTAAKELFLARDAFGIKPLYYAMDGRTFRFASQVKALQAGGAISREPDPAGVAGFLLWGAVPDPFTMYRSIRAVEAGTTMLVRADGTTQSSRFFDVRAELLEAQEAGASASDHVAGLANAIELSVGRHMVADVPVAVFLSAGIDSGAIASIASDLAHGRLRTLTVGFDEYRGTPLDETVLAARVADHFGTSHSEHSVSRREFEEDLPSLMAAMDQPSIDGVNTWLVAKAAARAGMKVALSGLGGDEIFAGYPSFHQVPALQRRLGPVSRIPGMGKALRRVSAPWMGRVSSPKYAGLLEYGGSLEGSYLLRRALHMPWEVADLLDPRSARDGLEELHTMSALRSSVADVKGDVARVAALESQWYMKNQLLRDADWAGMAHSIEIRVPFVDVDLFRFVARSMATREPLTKAHVVKGLTRPLPQESASRPKTGFATPVRTWIDSSGHSSERGLRGWGRRVLESQLDRGRGILPTQRLTQGSVAIFQIGQLGDTLVTLPAISEIRRRHPRTPMVLVTDSHQGKERYVSSWSVVGPLGWFDAVVPYAPAAGMDAVRTGVRVARDLRRLRARTVYNMVPTQRTPMRALRDAAFFRLMARASHYFQAPAFEAPPRTVEGLLPELEPEWARLLRMQGGQPSDEVMCLPKMPEHDALADAIFTDLELTPGIPVVALAPGAKMPSKRWPIARFIEVLTKLRQEFPEARFIILGDASDAAAWGGEFPSGDPKVHVLAGELGVFESAAILRRCDLFVGNDTGTMHLAAMSGCRGVALFSSRDYPGRWHPAGAEVVALRTRIECEGCMLVECVERKNECLRRIGADPVIAAARQILVRRLESRRTG